MALARDQISSISFYANFLDPISSPPYPNYSFNDYNQREDRDCLDDSLKTNDMHELEAHESSACFKTGYLNTFGGSNNLLSFEQDLDPEQNNISYTTKYQKISQPSSKDEDPCHDMWLYSDDSVSDTPPQPRVSPPQNSCFAKRTHPDEENKQALKKQCRNNASKKLTTKPNSSSESKDPQSIVAKNRREKISERLKILQDLVPNGSKVDLVTMLEKAIGYVKFLQMQMKVLAADEFWPSAGGKVPDISQVREAIDSIISSQRSERDTTLGTTN